MRAASLVIVLAAALATVASAQTGLASNEWALNILEQKASGMEVSRSVAAWHALMEAADSSAHFGAVEDLARAFAARGDRRETANAFFTLRLLGARRPYLRAFAFAPNESPILAGAATTILTGDARAEELAELQPLAREIFDAGIPDGQAFVGAVNTYGATVPMVEKYHQIEDLRERAVYLFLNFSVPWAQSRFRDLLLAEPEAVREAVLAYSYPVPENAPPAPCDTPRSETTQEEILRLASSTPIPPPTIPGPLATACGGREPTVYVSPEARIVGGPDDGLPFRSVLRGTNSADVISGTPGADRLEGGGGGDVLCGFAGSDTLIGGEGADHAYGGYGDDTCDAEKLSSCGERSTE